MLGFGMQLPQITPAVVREVASDLRLDYTPAAEQNEKKDDGAEGRRAGLNFLSREKSEQLYRPEEKSFPLSDVLRRVKSE
jgi:hypothetical protein